MQAGRHACTELLCELTGAMLAGWHVLYDTDSISHLQLHVPDASWLRNVLIIIIIITCSCPTVMDSLDTSDPVGMPGHRLSVAPLEVCDIVLVCNHSETNEIEDAREWRRALLLKVLLICMARQA